MQLIGYSPPQLDLDTIPGLRRVYTWTSASVQQTARRVVALTTLIDRSEAADICGPPQSTPTRLGPVQR